MSPEMPTPSPVEIAQRAAAVRFQRLATGPGAQRHGTHGQQRHASPPGEVRPIPAGTQTVIEMLRERLYRPEKIAAVVGLPLEDVMRVLEHQGRWRHADSAVGEFYCDTRVLDKKQIVRCPTCRARLIRTPCIACRTREVMGQWDQLHALCRRAEVIVVAPPKKRTRKRSAAVSQG